VNKTLDINIICSSYKTIRAESYSREEFIKNYKSLSEKYKLDNIKEELYNKLYSIYESYGERNLNVYFPDKNIKSLASVLICNQNMKKEDVLNVIKLKLISLTEDAIKRNTIKANLLNFYGILFLNLLKNVNEITEPFLKTDVESLKNTEKYYHTTYEIDRRDITEKEFKLLSLFGIISIYAGVNKADSYKYAKDILTVVMAYERGYI
jgi:hypothetical protein